MNKTTNRIIFRADGNAIIGLGHIVRCLALAEILSPAFDCSFITKKSDKISEFISPYCSVNEIPPLPAMEEISVVREFVTKNDILVVDSYEFTGEYQHEIKSYVKKLVVIDDMAAIHFYADLIINHGTTHFESDCT